MNNQNNSELEASAKRPLVIGITGGIASGKSSIAAMFSGRGIIHVDADKLVHQLMRNDHEMIAEIIHHFPRANDGGAINRTALAAHIAKYPEALASLEHIIHPRVRAHEEAVISAARRNGLRAVVLDIPLLFETDADSLCDAVVVAHAPLHHRKRRAFARPGMTQVKWEKLLSRQLPDHVRNHAADVVIPTSIGKAATRRFVHRLMVEWGLL